MDMIALAAAALAGGAILLIFMGLFGNQQRAVVERLEQYGVGSQRGPAAAVRPRSQRPTIGELIGQSAALGALNRLVERRTWSEAIARDLARADLSLKPAEYLAIRVAAIIGAVAGTWLLGRFLPTLANPLALVLAGFLGFVVPRLYVGRRQALRLRAFNAHLADTITLIANALRSGSSFLQSLELVVRETQPPISTEFGRVIREVNLGLAMEQALNNLVRRVRSDDLELMTTAILIQYQVGGNLAEILDTIAFTIRERVRIKGEIRTLTAQQRLSGYVVGFLPVALLGVVNILAPRFMAAMFEPPSVLGIPIGVYLLAIGATFMAIGFMFIRRIVDIEI